MKYLGMLIDGFVALLDILELFFFSPLSEVVARLSSLLVGNAGTVATLFQPVLEWVQKQTLGNLGNITLVQLLLGSGLLIFLVYKLVLFLVPIAD